MRKELRKLYILLKKIIKQLISVKDLYKIGKETKRK